MPRAHRDSGDRREEGPCHSQRLAWHTEPRRSRLERTRAPVPTSSWSALCQARRGDSRLPTTRLHAPRWQEPCGVLPRVSAQCNPNEHRIDTESRRTRSASGSPAAARRAWRCCREGAPGLPVPGAEPRATRRCAAPGRAGFHALAVPHRSDLI